VTFIVLFIKHEEIYNTFVVNQILNKLTSRIMTLTRSLPSSLQLTSLLTLFNLDTLNIGIAPVCSCSNVIWGPRDSLEHESESRGPQLMLEHKQMGVIAIRA